MKTFYGNNEELLKTIERQLKTKEKIISVCFLNDENFFLNNVRIPIVQDIDSLRCATEIGINCPFHQTFSDTNNYETKQSTSTTLYCTIAIVIKNINIEYGNFKDLANIYYQLKTFNLPNKVFRLKRKKGTFLLIPFSQIKC